jgi:hypothetical protein
VFSRGQCDNNEVLLNYPGVARYLLRNGNEILVDAAPNADDGDVRARLLGPAFGALCFQRGIVPLHASVIDFADGCVAFIGAKGAGKSTIVAALARRGHQVIADDICRLQIRDDGTLLAWPGVSRVRLHEDALTALGYDGLGIERETRKARKYFVPVSPLPSPARSRRLHRIYQLHVAPSSSRANMTRVQGAAAIEALMRNVFKLKFAEHMGFRPVVFSTCAATANEVPQFRYSRTIGFQDMHEDLDFLEQHLNTVC